jgi:hypothetical protein
MTQSVPIQRCDVAAQTRTTRLPADLIEAAEAHGRREHRSAAKQIEHWARFGLYFEGLSTAARARIQRAVTGEMAVEHLDEDERQVANAEIDARISVAANESSFADRLAASGITTVGLDDRGRMVRRHPDGSTTPL